MPHYTSVFILRSRLCSSISNKLLTFTVAKFKMPPSMSFKGSLSEVWQCIWSLRHMFLSYSHFGSPQSHVWIMILRANCIISWFHNISLMVWYIYISSLSKRSILSSTDSFLSSLLHICPHGRLFCWHRVATSGSWSLCTIPPHLIVKLLSEMCGALRRWGATLYTSLIRYVFLNLFW